MSKNTEKTNREMVVEIARIAGIVALAWRTQKAIVDIVSKKKK